MRYLKRPVLMGFAVIAVAAISAPASASATTLEITGVPQNQAVAMTMSLQPGTSAIFRGTNGSSPTTCTESAMAGSTTSPFTGSTVTAPLSTLSFSKCTASVTVDKAGTIHIAHIAGTTDGTLSSSGAEITVWSPIIGGYLSAKTGSGTHIGVLKGVKHGHASVQVNAVLNAGFLVPSLVWEGNYVVTSPTNLGVVA